MKKRLIVWALVIAMALAVMPMAFAEEGDVASVNGVGYATVQDAADAANGAVVTLLADSMQKAKEARYCHVSDFDL